MVPAPFIVLLDANVLFPFSLRDTLLRAAVAAKVLGESRELAKARSPILVALLLEREDVLDPQASMLASLAERDAPLVEQTD
jgi:hypothetical protein